jgi:hypothetical protein
MCPITNPFRPQWVPVAEVSFGRCRFLILLTSNAVEAVLIDRAAVTVVESSL